MIESSHNKTILTAVWGAFSYLAPLKAVLRKAQAEGKNETLKLNPLEDMPCLVVKVMASSDSTGGVVQLSFVGITFFEQPYFPFHSQIKENIYHWYNVSGSITIWSEDRLVHGETRTKTGWLGWMPTMFDKHRNTWKHYILFYLDVCLFSYCSFDYLSNDFISKVEQGELNCISSKQSVSINYNTSNESHYPSLKLFFIFQT